MTTTQPALRAHILAMGGGGFSMNPHGGVTGLDRYALELTGQRSPLVCFAPTAAMDSPQYINKFLMAFGALGVRTMVLTLWEGARRAIERLAEADVVYVGGGSTVNLVALWQAHGIDRRLRQLATEKELVLAGLSAGAACWFEACATDSFGGMDPWRGGLGFLPGSFCPHYDSEAERAPSFSEWIADGTLPSGWACDDGAAIHFRDGVPIAHLAEQPGQRSWRVRASNNPATSGVLAEPQEMQQV